MAASEETSSRTEVLAAVKSEVENVLEEVGDRTLFLGPFQILRFSPCFAFWD